MWPSFAQVGQVPKSSIVWLTSKSCVLGGHRVGPAFDCWSLDLDGAAAPAADQVVVVRVAALAIDGFARVCLYDVNKPVVGHQLKGAINGRETDRFALATEDFVDVLRAAELVGRADRGRDRPSLACGGGSPNPGRSWILLKSRRTTENDYQSYLWSPIQRQ